MAPVGCPGYSKEATSQNLINCSSNIILEWVETDRTQLVGQVGVVQEGSYVRVGESQPQLENG